MTSRAGFWVGRSIGRTLGYDPVRDDFDTRDGLDELVTQRVLGGMSDRMRLLDLDAFARFGGVLHLAVVGRHDHVDRPPVYAVTGRCFLI